MTEVINKVVEFVVGVIILVAFLRVAWWLILDKD